MAQAAGRGRCTLTQQQRTQARQRSSAAAAAAARPAGWHVRGSAAARPQVRRRAGFRASDESSGESEEPTPTRYAPGSVVFRSKASGSARQPAFPLTVPLLPFPVGEVLTPGASKVLHLYEARYLSLLERVIKADPPVFVHAVCEQPIDPGSGSVGRLPGALVGGDFALALGTLVQVVEVKAQGVGALVRVQGEGRVAIDALTQAQPYIVASVSPLLDDPVPAAGVSGALEAADAMTAAMRECADLCARFGGAEAAALQQACVWSERPALVPGLAIAPEQAGAAPGLDRAHRVAWAALSAMPLASRDELKQLLRYRLSAMAAVSTPDRLQLAAKCLDAAKGMLAARVALRSLNIGSP